MPNVNMIRDKELAFKFASLYPQVTLSSEMAYTLLLESHNQPFHKRDEWILTEAGIICEEGTTFRVIYPKKLTYAMLKYA